MIIRKFEEKDIHQMIDIGGADKILDTLTPRNDYGVLLY